MQPSKICMAEKKKTTASPAKTSAPVPGLFTKDNYIWMLAGIVLMAIGMVLMAGGKSNDPTQFDTKQVYSAMRISVAPILILIGCGIEIFAIFRKPKTN